MHNILIIFNFFDLRFRILLLHRKKEMPILCKKWQLKVFTNVLQMRYKYIIFLAIFDHENDLLVTKNMCQVSIFAWTWYTKKSKNIYQNLYKEDCSVLGDFFSFCWKCVATLEQWTLQGEMYWREWAGVFKSTFPSLYLLRHCPQREKVMGDLKYTPKKKKKKNTGWVCWGKQKTHCELAFVLNGIRKNKQKKRNTSTQTRHVKR